MKVTILGCGGSSGTPAADHRGWGACDPENPRNSRLRPSILVDEEGQGEDHARILVDTSPDLRRQLLNVGVNRLDGVVYTHAHADHLNGIDDLRAVNRAMKAPLDIFGNSQTLDIIKERFGYAFEPLAAEATHYYKPTLIPHLIKDGDAFDVGGVNVTAFQQDHRFCQSMGLRFGPIAYSTDAVEMPESAFELLKGVEVWIVGALSEKPHPTHAHVDLALEWIARVKPRRAVLTHLDIYLDYDELSNKLPEGVEAAYDGMVIET